MHCKRYTQSSSPIIIPKSISLHLSFPHFLHLKSCPEKSFFSATPIPVLVFVIFSVIRIGSFVSRSVFVLHLLHVRNCLFPFVVIISIFLHVGQNSIVILFSAYDDL